MPNRPPSTGPTADTDSDAMLGFLTNQQHLHPHDSLSQVMDLAVDHFGCCPQAISRGLEWLKLDGESAIGRLRRSELVQLAKAVHRFWSQSASETSAASR